MFTFKLGKHGASFLLIFETAVQLFSASKRSLISAIKSWWIDVNMVPPFLDSVNFVHLFCKITEIGIDQELTGDNSFHFLASRIRWQKKIRLSSEISIWLVETIRHKIFERLQACCIDFQEGSSGWSFMWLSASGPTKLVNQTGWNQIKILVIYFYPTQKDLVIKFVIPFTHRKVLKFCTNVMKSRWISDFSKWIWGLSDWNCALTSLSWAHDSEVRHRICPGDRILCFAIFWLKRLKVTTTSRTVAEVVVDSTSSRLIGNLFAVLEATRCEEWREHFTVNK